MTVDDWRRLRQDGDRRAQRPGPRRGRRVRPGAGGLVVRPGVQRLGGPGDVHRARGGSVQQWVEVLDTAEWPGTASPTFGRLGMRSRWRPSRWWCCRRWNSRPRRGADSGSVSLPAAPYGRQAATRMGARRRPRAPAAARSRGTSRAARRSRRPPPPPWPPRPAAGRPAAAGRRCWRGLSRAAGPSSNRTAGWRRDVRLPVPRRRSAPPRRGLRDPGSDRRAPAPPARGRTWSRPARGDEDEPPGSPTPPPMSRRCCTAASARPAPAESPITTTSPAPTIAAQCAMSPAAPVTVASALLGVGAASGSLLLGPGCVPGASG